MCVITYGLEFEGDYAETINIASTYTPTDRFGWTLKSHWMQPTVDWDAVKLLSLSLHRTVTKQERQTAASGPKERCKWEFMKGGINRMSQMKSLIKNILDTTHIKSWVLQGTEQTPLLFHTNRRSHTESCRSEWPSRMKKGINRRNQVQRDLEASRSRTRDSFRRIAFRNTNAYTTDWCYYKTWRRGNG